VDQARWRLTIKLDLLIPIPTPIPSLPLTTSQFPAMSMLHIGTSCVSCNLVDFLPTTCPGCKHTFCSTHIQSHHPCTTSIILGQETNPIAGPSTFASKAICELRGCERVRIEAVGGLEVEREGIGAGVVKKVRCEGCKGAHCVSCVAYTSLQG
jgi:hypothetical protein